MSEPRVRVSLTDGVLDVELPEKLVLDLVEKFTAVIQTALAGGAQHAAARVASVASAPPSPEVAFNDIFAATGTGVQVLRAVPGSTKAMRAVNVAKLYLYGLQALKQRDTALFAEIGRACKAHGCFDSKNMASSLKAQRTSFVFGGTGKRQTLRLSAPGMDETAALVARIRTAGKGIAQRKKGIAQDSLRIAGH